MIREGSLVRIIASVEELAAISIGISTAMQMSGSTMRVLEVKPRPRGKTGLMIYLGNASQLLWVLDKHVEEVEEESGTQ